MLLNSTFLRPNRTPILLAFLSIVFYYLFAYDLVRTDNLKLISLYISLFILFYFLVRIQKENIRFLTVLALLFRFVFLFSIPNLSQDFYRFIWDGELVGHFMNPYLNVPNTLIEQPDLIISNAQELHKGMGNLSANHFSNYAPLNQFIFALAALLGGKSILGSVIVMRSIIILADIGIFYFGRKLLININQSPRLIFWYFLNPLVIIELTGNLHFEGVMLFFFVWAIYLLSVHKWQWAAFVYACSISVKLVPLLFLPLFLNHFKFKKAVLFYTIIIATSLLLFAPFYSSEFVTNYSKTIGLWFSNFEFNAGLYNIIKQIGAAFNIKPWELIKIYGKIIPILTIVAVFLFTFSRKNKNLSTLLTSMLWVLTLYYLISPTVHPWYVIFLVALTAFTKYRFAVIWSALIVLSYFSYSVSNFEENLWLVAIEYTIVCTFLIYELITQPNKT